MKMSFKQEIWFNRILSVLLFPIGLVLFPLVLVLAIFEKNWEHDDDKYYNNKLSGFPYTGHGKPNN